MAGGNLGGFLKEVILEPRLERGAESERWKVEGCGSRGRSGRKCLEDSEMSDSRWGKLGFDFISGGEPQKTSELRNGARAAVTMMTVTMLTVAVAGSTQLPLCKILS